MDFNEKGFLGTAIIEFSNLVQQKYKDFFETCYNINELAQATKFNLSIHNKDGQEVMAAILFMRVLNGFQGVVVLAKMGLVTEAKVVLRSILEALFYLKLICDDESFVKEYILSDQVRRLKWMNIAHQNNSPLFDELRQYATPEISQKLKNEINNHNIKDLKKEQVANRAKLQEMYNTDYRLLSEEVHIVPRSLEHYINTDMDGVITDFPWGPSDDDLKYVLFTAVRILFMGLVAVTKLLRWTLMFLLRILTKNLRYLLPNLKIYKTRSKKKPSLSDNQSRGKYGNQ